MGVREPAADRDGVLRVEDVRGWRVVDNDGVLQVTANLREILEYMSTQDTMGAGVEKTYLDIVTLVIITAFAEQPVMYNTMNVKLVEKWVAVLCLLALASRR